MNDKPYALIVDGNGLITERKLANHGPGNQLEPSSIVVVSNTVYDNVRTLVVQRPVKGASKDHFSLPLTPGDLNMISAVGNSVHLGGRHLLLFCRFTGTIQFCPKSQKPYDVLRSYLI